MQTVVLSQVRQRAKMGHGEKGLIQTSITPEKYFCEPMAVKHVFVPAGWFGGMLKRIFYRSLKS